MLATKSSATAAANPTGDSTRENAVAPPTTARRVRADTNLRTCMAILVLLRNAQCDPPRFHWNSGKPSCLCARTRWTAECPLDGEAPGTAGSVQPTALVMTSTTFFASPNTIMVL